MKIESPLSRVDETEKLIESGAKELYCGICPINWKSKYTILGCNNRSEHSLGNLSNVNELRQVVEIAKSYEVPVFLTMNGLYTKKQYPMLMKLTEKVLNTNIEALIVADIPYLLSLNKLGSGIKIHISTGGTVFNSETVDFYKNLGASRIILPRHLTIREIGGIAKKAKKTELTTFIFYGIDANIDGFCTFHHGLREHHLRFGDLPLIVRNNRVLAQLIRYIPNFILNRAKKTKLMGNLPACWLEYDVKVIPESKNLDVKPIKERISNSYSFKYMIQPACGVCALFDFKKFGISSIKIVGRDNASNDKINYVRFVHKAFGLLDKSNSKEHFIKNCQELYQNTFKVTCLIPRCYYSSALKKELV